MTYMICKSNIIAFDGQRLQEQHLLTFSFSHMEGKLFFTSQQSVETTTVVSILCWITIIIVDFFYINKNLL